MKKSDKDNCPESDVLFNAALDIAGAEYSKVQYGYGEETEADARQRLTELAKPLTMEECNAIGAPAEGIANSADGKLTTQLRDTTKSPNAINAHAHAERLRLAKDARCLMLAADMTESLTPQNSAERAFCHQLAALHAHGMRYMEKSADWLDRADPCSPVYAQMSIEATRAANTANRMFKAFGDGMLALAKLRGGGQQKVTVVHQHVQVAGGNVAVAGNVTRGG